MAFDFPTAPATGTLYAPSGGPTYRWDGTVWSQIAQPFQGAFPSDTAPTNPVHGQLWWETDTGLLYVYYTDANSSQWVEVVSSSMPDPPADGNEYVRVNGVWRLKSQSYDLAGKTSQDFAVPAWGPSIARLSLWAQIPSAMYQMLRFSGDGTTFYAGATDYQMTGFTHYTGSLGFANMVQGNNTEVLLTTQGDNLTILQSSIVTLILKRGATGLITWQVRGETFGSSATVLFATNMLTGYLNGPVLPANSSIKALRWATSSAVALTTGWLTVEWLP
jgi:hypothetical protein